ncbi:MAG TPA: alpha/beta hydrolase [Gammaproteobacteria bacterium]|nr:alpha/beta hydrolase [Gammaproteobacteria bacterium]
MKKDISRLLKIAPVVLFAGALLAGCNGSSSKNPAPPAPEREQDTRTFTAALPSEAMLAALDISDATLYAGLHDGEHGQASYLIQVPENWNRILVMYAHGYRGEGAELTVTPPRIQKELIAARYAWAASSYSSNYYDVRSGVEDTNALALAFEQLTGNAHGSPAKYYIIGHSMGGHVAGAAIEAETLATANNVVEYAGAVPMCGVMGDTELFNYFAAYNVAAQRLAGITEEVTAENYETEILPRIKETLWVDYGSIDLGGGIVLTGAPTSPEGERLLDILMNLSGGKRPMYHPTAPLSIGASQLTAWHDLLLGYGVPNGNINGILNKNVLDTRNITYRWETTAPDNLSADEQDFNNSVIARTPDADANAPRSDGLRWIPKVNGAFNVPVVSIHTLGDLFVPFSMQQIYAERAAANGSDQWLVQRAMRTINHCDFKNEEEWSAFQAMAAWEQHDVVPEGDDVLDPAVISQANYGCRFTSEDRPGLAPCPR